MVKFSRRGFIIGGVAVGGTLALGVGFLATVDTDGLDPYVGSDGSVHLNAWVTIYKDGRIVFSIPRNEMGQGVFTSLPMLIAEEMEVDLDDANVSVEHPTENLPVYANFVLALRKRPEMVSGAGDWLGKKVFGLVPFIATGGSSSIVDAYTPLRRVGATAREMLISAAAKSWSVSKSECYAEAGHIIHKPTGQGLAYGDLAEAAAHEKPNKSPKMRSPADFKLIGRPQKRLDIPAKTRGEAKFGIDTLVEGMLYAYVLQSPVFGGTVVSIDDGEARKVKGYRKTVNMGDSVAVVAENTYYAKKAVGLLKVEFDSHGNEKLNSETIHAMLHSALDSGDTHVFSQTDNFEEKINSGRVFEATYDVPYLAHACMEPMNATAVIRDGHAEIWTSTQTPLSMKWGADRGVDDIKSVVGHTCLSGGGFGRRAEGDMVVHAVKVAAALPGIPVKTIWSREEDIQHDMYRPAVAAKIKATIGDDGKPKAIDYKIALQSVGLSFSRRNMPFEEGGLKDPGSVEGAEGMPYAIPAKRVSNANIDIAVPVGNWRSVGHSFNSFFVESFIDELAVESGIDPLIYRMGLVAGHKRMSPLVEKLAELARWGGPVEKGKGRGVALHPSFRSFAGQVIDISMTETGAVKVDRVTCVIDCGQIVNPDTVVAQMESGIIYGLTAAMYGEITLDGGCVVQSNFPDYPMLKMYQTPEIEVHIMKNGELPGGVGEPGTPPVFPALANAYFSMTGRRLRSMPLAKHGVEFA